jgi:hypothetical protein
LEQLPEADLDREILVRTDIGGCTHAFTRDCRDASIRFSVGYEVDERVREAVLKTPESAWQSAIDAEGKVREGAWVSELTDDVDLSAWPEGPTQGCALGLDCYRWNLRSGPYSLSDLGFP